MKVGNPLDSTQFSLSSRDRHPENSNLISLVGFASSVPLLFGWDTVCSRFELAHRRVGESALPGLLAM